MSTFYDTSILRIGMLLVAVLAIPVLTVAFGFYGFASSLVLLVLVAVAKA